MLNFKRRKRDEKESIKCITGSSNGNRYAGRMRCETSRGTCSTCNGSGRVQKYQHGIGWEWYDCSHCSMGECRFCGGSGKA